MSIRDRWNAQRFRAYTFWKAHQQELMGTISYVSGIVEVIDMNTVNAISGFFGPTYGPYVSKGIMIVSGFLVARRARQVKRA